MAGKVTIIGLVVVSIASMYFYWYTTKPIIAESLSPEAPLLTTVSVDVRTASSRDDIVAAVSDALSLSDADMQAFASTLRAMQWDAFNGYLLDYLIEEYALTEREQEIFLTHSEVHLDVADDILSPLFIPEVYVLDSIDSFSHQAQQFIEPVLAVPNPTEYIAAQVTEESVTTLQSYLTAAQVLLPDLLPLPPQDLGVEQRNGVPALVFSTIYYNAGRGNLELRGDPATLGTPGDFERKVLQRIYNEDKTYTDTPAGIFTWHHSHLHYHFADFVTYELTDSAGQSITPDDTYLQKSTFCVRDISKMDIPLENAETVPDAAYRICGRERQGITAGWGDAYFYTYPDQNIPIANLPSGDYRLTFNVNPANRFQEETLENNVAWANFRYDKASSTITVLETVPAILPTFENIHIEQTI